MAIPTLRYALVEFLVFSCFAANPVDCRLFVRSLACLAAVGAVYAGTRGLPEGGEVVLARVPVGTEVACAEKLAIDTNVLAAQPNTPAGLELARQ